MHLRHGAPPTLLEALLQCLLSLLCQAVRAAGVVGSSIVEQSLDSTLTKGIKPLLDRRPGTTYRCGHLFKVVRRVEAESYGQKPFTPGTRRFSAEQILH